MKKSESVFIENVNMGLIEYIKNTVVLLDKKTNTNVSIPVFVAKADEDYKIEIYPCITIKHLYAVRDEIRHNPNTVVVDRDIPNHKLIEEYNAIPYNLTYQIDFWSKTGYQMNDMLRIFFGNLPNKYFNLDVYDDSKIKRNCFVLQQGRLMNKDLMYGNSRLFHSFITYKVQVELDEKIQIESPMITSIEVKSNFKKFIQDIKP